MQHQIKKLRDREALRLWDKVDKTFVNIQINRKEKYLCWERWISKDQRNWIKLNGYLSLREVWIILQGIKEKIEIELITN